MRLSALNTGQILSQNTPTAPTQYEYLDKNCVLLTEGTFNSMDGEVTITSEHLDKIAQVYNEKIDAIKAEGREPVMADYQPAQLDHSVSAKDTIGRLIGPLSVAEVNGKQTLFGVIRFLGSEAIEKVSDGRWTHLSVGINSLETCVLDEITVTPFPACKDAILFSEKGKKMNEDEKKEKEDEKKLSEDKDEDDKKEEKKLTEDKDEDDKKEEKKLSEDKDEDDKKEEKKLTEDKDEDDKKEEKKLADEKAEHEKGETQSEEKEEHKTKLSAALSTMKKKQESFRLAIKTANINSRFARLRSEAKVTPAEMKKIDVARLAKSSDETIAAVLESYENRQPAVHTAVLATVNAVNVAKVAEEIKLAEMRQIEKESRARFSSIPKKDDEQSNNDMNFSDNKTPESKEQTGHIDLWDEIVKSIKVGDEKTAHEMYCKMRGAKLEADTCEASELDMKHLMAEFSALENEYSEVIRLSALSTGIKI